MPTSHLFLACPSCCLRSSTWLLRALIFSFARSSSRRIRSMLLVRCTIFVRISGSFRSISRLSASELCNRSEEHTSDLQSHLNLVCRLLLEKKKKNKIDVLNVVIFVKVLLIM